MEQNKWEEKEYLANLHYLIPPMTEKQWELVLAVIQGKIHNVLAARDNEIKEMIIKSFGEFLLADWSGENEVYSEIFRLENIILDKLQPHD